MLKIGLTGGIGCGKSTVARLFSQYAIPCLDADDIAHQLVAVGQPALLTIAETFGRQSLNPDGSLNRAYLRDLVFSSPDQKQQLEAILHPLVYQTMTEQMAVLDAPYCLLSIPLLFETQKTAFVDRILVIDCPEELQIKRVMARDSLSLDRVQSIIASQVSRDFRLSHADDVINNDQTTATLAQQVEKLHNLYLSTSISTG